MITIEMIRERLIESIRPVIRRRNLQSGLGSNRARYRAMCTGKSSPPWIRLPTFAKFSTPTQIISSASTENTVQIIPYHRQYLYVKYFIGITCILISNKLSHNEISMITLAQIQSRLIEVIKQSGMSQTELARQLGIKQPTVGQYLSGRALPALDTLANLCKILDADANYILCQNENEDA